MSQINFIDTPFPDNHNGFDYSPKSFTDVQREELQKVQHANNSAQEKKTLSMLASIFK